ncbi:hypothetical protein QBC46DRAFT_417563 [Diplogelasinospora grovesii]|uniref:Uncharacterized protein n=1 Tax=Diplogelasinospora grovesii TaxID=303347 RepID=A0AAN6N367_9PEZI|nr:hypothetical protein QBC46DRAFT_417563 [Diplogelasinospora grovesii]
MAQFSDLPVEVVERIIDGLSVCVHCRGEEQDLRATWGPALETQALSALSRCCRGLRDLAQPVLYHRYPMHIGTEKDPHLRLTQFLRTLIKRPDLARLVVALELDWYPNGWETRRVFFCLQDADVVLFADAARQRGLPVPDLEWAGGGRRDITFAHPGWVSMPLAACWGLWGGQDMIIHDGDPVVNTPRGILQVPHVSNVWLAAGEAWLRFAVQLALGLTHSNLEYLEFSELPKKPCALDIGRGHTPYGHRVMAAPPHPAPKLPSLKRLRVGATTPRRAGGDLAFLDFNLTPQTASQPTTVEAYFCNRVSHMPGRLRGITRLELLFVLLTWEDMEALRASGCAENLRELVYVQANQGIAILGRALGRRWPEDVPVTPQRLGDLLTRYMPELTAKLESLVIDIPECTGHAEDGLRCLSAFKGLKHLSICAKIVQVKAWGFTHAHRRRISWDWFDVEILDLFPPNIESLVIFDPIASAPFCQTDDDDDLDQYCSILNTLRTISQSLWVDTAPIPVRDSQVCLTGRKPHADSCGGRSPRFPHLRKITVCALGLDRELWQKGNLRGREQRRERRRNDWESPRMTRCDCGSFPWALEHANPQFPETTDEAWEGQVREPRSRQDIISELQAQFRDADIELIVSSAGDGRLDPHRPDHAPVLKLAGQYRQIDRMLHTPEREYRPKHTTLGYSYKDGDMEKM